MDAQSKDILKQLLERLDKMDSQQHKLDRVMERLDTLQNVIQRQNQRQNLLHQKIVEMTMKLEQKNVITTDQSQGAEQESVEPFRATDNQVGSSLLQQKTTQPLQEWGKQIDHKLKSIEERTVDTAQMCHQLTSWSSNIEDKMTELADNKVETMKTFLVEIRSVKDLIKGQTNSELIWLISQTDKKLSDIGSAVRDIHQQKIGTKEETIRSMGQVVETVIRREEQQGNTNVSVSAEIYDKHTQAIIDLERNIQQLNSSISEMPREIKTSLDTILTTCTQLITRLENIIKNWIAEMNKNSKEQSLSVNKTIQSDVNKGFDAVQSELQTNRTLIIKDSETQTNKIISRAETAKEDLKRLIRFEQDDTSKYKVELGNIHALIHFLMLNIRENTSNVVKKIDKTNDDMKKEHTVSNKKCQELVADLKVNIKETKHEICAVAEKEALAVRNQMKALPKSEDIIGFCGAAIVLLIVWFLYRWIFA